MYETSNNVILKDPKLSNNISAINSVNSPKNFSLMPILSIIGLVAVLTLTLPLIIRFCTNKDKKYIRLPFNSTQPNKTDELQKDNSITANYLINEGDKDTTLFHSSYLDSIESIKINDNPINITNSYTFEKSGNNKVEIKFKNKLKTLNDLFFNCQSLNEVNLYNLSSDEITSTADMFNGCTNLQKVNFSDFDTTNINNMTMIS